MSLANKTHWVLETGGIGAGKTAVSDRFKKRKVPVIDTDVLSRQLTSKNGKALAAIEKAFGPKVIDSENGLNRLWMRHQAFFDSKIRLQLEAILHPMIFQEVKNLQYEVCAPYGLVVVPVFSRESPYWQIIDRVLVVDVDEETQIHRVETLRHLPHSVVKNIMATQLSRQERLLLADDVIVNSGSLSELDDKVEFFHRFYTKLFTV